jgi:hypothetical protein
MKELTITFLILIQTIFLFGQKDDSKEILSIAEISEETFENSGKIEKPEVDLSLIKKENGTIKIPNKNISGTFVTFTDDTRPEENKINNEYQGYYPSIKKHLIRTQYYEGSRTILIGEYNNKTTIWGAPNFSKDGEYFFAYKSYGLEGEPVGLQIWAVDKNTYSPDHFGLKKIFELNQLLFNPLEFKWDIDNSILIKGQVLKNHWYPTKDSEIRFWRLIFN